MRLVFFLVSILGPVQVLAAQQVASLQPGARVRITAPTLDMHRRVGEVAEVTSDTIVVVFEPDALPRPIPLAAVTQADVSLGRGPSVGGGATGAVIGLLGGAALGLLIGEVSQSSSCSDCVYGELGAAVGGGSGLILGFIIGVAIPREKWRSISLPSQIAGPGAPQSRRPVEHQPLSKR